MDKRAACFSLLFLFILFPFTLQAQRLTVEQNTIDVGRTGYEMPVTATFRLHNRGSRHITITTVHPDCGCTVAEWPQRSIAGGEHFQVTLTYNALMLGHFEKQAAVVVQGMREPLWLTMTGVVDADYHDYSRQYPYNFAGLLADADQVEFDNVNKGDHPEVELHVLNNTTADVTPNLLHLPQWLTALAQPEVLAPGQAGTVTLTLNSLLVSDFGLTRQSIYLAKALGERVNAEIELPLSVVLLPDLSAYDGQNRQHAPRLQLSADHLDLGLQGGKMRKSGTIVLKNTGHSPLTVTSLQMFTGGMTVTLGKRELQPGETTKLKVKIDPAQLRRERTRPRVLMITNDPEHAKVVVEVRVRGDK